MRHQVFHLVGEHAPSLEEDVFRIGRRERHRDQLHARLLGGARGLLVVAAAAGRHHVGPQVRAALAEGADVIARQLARDEALAAVQDRKSTRLNSSHLVISYAVFCLKKNKTCSSVDATHSIYCEIKKYLSASIPKQSIEITIRSPVEYGHDEQRVRHHAPLLAHEHAP